MSQTENPIITIATVTFNAEDTLARTLESVASQTYPHIEHLIIDGCSTDKTTEIIHRYVDANVGKEIAHDIRFIREPDRGLYDAMNKAIMHATGNYIVFLNAGDKLHDSNSIEQAFSKLSSPLPAIVYGETDIVNEQGDFLRHRRLQAPERLQWKDFRWGMLVCHQSFYVRTDWAKQEVYDLRYRFSADYDWCVRLLKRACREKQAIHNSRMILTDYLSEGMTTLHHKSSLWERFRIMSKHYGLVPTIAQHLWFVIRALTRK